MSGGHPTTDDQAEAWTYAPSLSDAPKHTIYGPRGEVFATVYRSKDRARLVAAAPELLALARQYASECAECGGTGMDSLGLLPCIDCEDILKVIAKAQGKL